MKSNDAASQERRNTLLAKTTLWYTNNSDNENNPSILKIKNEVNGTFSIPTRDHLHEGTASYEETTEPRRLLKKVTDYDSVEEMPWSTSLSPSYTNHNRTLPFMPYYTFTKNTMFSKLHNVQPYKYNDKNVGIATNSAPSERYFYHQKEDKARIINECYQSEEYRKIRLTYYDGGNQIQVFNSLWYPKYSLGKLPLLGIDLICFNGAKCLCVVDFQPLTCLLEDSNNDNDEQFGNSKWEEHLATLWDDLPTPLKGQMSKRFYDEHQFFSKSMIFGRFDIEKKSASKSGSDVINGNNSNSRGNEIQGNFIAEGGELWDAFEKYVTYHVDYVQEQYVKNEKWNDNDTKRLFMTDSGNDSLHFNLADIVKEGQRQYDEYSAERDPAKPMFCKVFGQEWGTGYVHDFLFDLSSDPNRE